CGVTFIDAAGRRTGGAKPKDFGFTFPEILLGNAILPPSTVLFRRSLLQRAGPFDVTLRQGEDYEYFIRCARHGTIGSVPQALVRYRRHAQQMSGNLRHIDAETLKIVDRHAALAIPERAAAISAYYRYGAACRALLRGDIGWTVENL